MTCEEVRTFVSNLLKRLHEPSRTTAAERIAVMRHTNDCQVCRLFVITKTEEMIKDLTTKEIEDGLNAGMRNLIHDSITEQTDPEL